MGYTKLFSSIIMSTVWQEPNHVRLVWITMLALREADNTVQASIPGLADAARVSIQECEQAIERLMSPDPYSRSQEFDGRRIEVCEGGWTILNGDVYRKRLNAEEQKERKKIWARNYRKKQKSVDGNVDKRRQTYQNVDAVDTVRVKVIEDIISSSEVNKNLLPQKISHPEDFIEQLRAEYPNVNIDHEAMKARRWLKLNPKGKGRKFTKRFFVNWLDRADSEIPGDVAASQGMDPDLFISKLEEKERQYDTH